MNTKAVKVSEEIVKNVRKINCICKKKVSATNWSKHERTCKGEGEKKVYDFGLDTFREKSVLEEETSYLKEKKQFQIKLLQKFIEYFTAKLISYEIHNKTQIKKICNDIITNFYDKYFSQIKDKLINRLKGVKITLIYDDYKDNNFNFNTLFADICVGNRDELQVIEFINNFNKREDKKVFIFSNEFDQFWNGKYKDSTRKDIFFNYWKIIETAIQQLYEEHELTKFYNKIETLSETQIFDCYDDIKYYIIEYREKYPSEENKLNSIMERMASIFLKLYGNRSKIDCLLEQYNNFISKTGSNSIIRETAEANKLIDCAKDLLIYENLNENERNKLCGLIKNLESRSIEIQLEYRDIIFENDAIRCGQFIEEYNKSVTIEGLNTREILATINNYINIFENYAKYENLIEKYKIVTNNLLKCLYKIKQLHTSIKGNEYTVTEDD